MWVQSRSVHFAEHPFTHEVDLYPDTDLDRSGLAVRVNRVIATSNVLHYSPIHDVQPHSCRLQV